MRNLPVVSWKTKVVLSVLLASFPAVAAAAGAEVQVLERKELPGGLVRELLRLPGFDPDEAVPAIAIHPASGGPFPLCFVLHYFRGAKEDMEAWCRDLAGQGVFAIAIDAHLHGKRSIAGVFHGDKIASLGEEYSIWVHQTSIARTAKDIPVALDALTRRSDVDVSRVAATGMSMGGSTALVLAWREPRVGVVASLVGAVDFWSDVTKLPPGAEQEAKKASYGPRLRELVTSIDPKPHPAEISAKVLCLINGGRDEYIDITLVRRFATDLEPRYAKDPGRLRFVPFPEVGHAVTDAMWKEAQQWIVRGLEKKPSEAKAISAIKELGGKVSVDEKFVPGTQSKILVETTTSDALAQRRLVDLIVKELGKAGITIRPDAPEKVDSSPRPPINPPAPIVRPLAGRLQT